MTTSAEDLRRKIAALLAKAAGTDNEHEAEAFASKARAMMKEHQLSMSEIHGATDPLDVDTIVAPWDHKVYQTLASSGARYLGCYLVMTKVWCSERCRVRRASMVFGRESARVTASLMIPYWWAECNRVGRRLHREGRLGSSASDAVHQVMIALAARLHSLAQESPARPGVPGMLVPLSEAEALARQMVALRFGGHFGSIGASDEARAAASGISLAGQVGASGALQIGGA